MVENMRGLIRAFQTGYQNINEVNEEANSNGGLYTHAQ